MEKYRKCTCLPGIKSYIRCHLLLKQEGLQIDKTFYDETFNKYSEDHGYTFLKIRDKNSKLKTQYPIHITIEMIYERPLKSLKHV